MIKMISFGSDLYMRSVMFRTRMLRTPLGLPMREEDTSGEETQLHFIALSEDERIIGSTVLKPLGEGRIKLRQMAVDHSTQNTGTGRKLVSFAENHARIVGMIYMEMHARMSAVGFYEKLGYHVEGESFIEVTVPTIRMTKKL